MLKNILCIFGVIVFSVCKLFLSLGMMVIKSLFIFVISIGNERY